MSAASYVAGWDVVEQTQRGEAPTVSLSLVAMETGKFIKLMSSEELRAGSVLELSGATDERTRS